MPLARLPGAAIWYELSSPDDPLAPHVALTHGFSSTRWGPAVDAFRRRFRLLEYHVRGHGKSSRPDDAAAYSVPAFARDLRDLLDALDIPRAHIAGVSMGGMISAQFACDYPERTRSVLLCDTLCGNAQDDSECGGVERRLVEIFSRFAYIAENHGLQELVDRENRYRREKDAYARLSRLSLDEQDALNQRKVGDMSVRSYCEVNRALRERPDLAPRLPSLPMPALVSCGEWDLFYPCARRDAALIPNARFATVRGAAHATPDYQPELWTRACFDFIDAVERGEDIRGELEYAPG
ncbi:MAG TPA: alpha/beta hydrolase [Dehalococcoidia bacterium]|nr:alpha/beta hydrolase [Dehalococcoidia bacterium]